MSGFAKLMCPRGTITFEGCITGKDNPSSNLMQKDIAAGLADGGGGAKNLVLRGI
jgi:hypothetical protein